MLYTTRKPAAEPDFAVLFLRTFLALLAAGLLGWLVGA